MAVVLVALPVLLVAGSAADGDGPTDYRVRAIFDNVSFAVPGEDVKMAGAKVGVIESMDVTPEKKAAVTLRIEDPRFTPFRSDARCTVRPQSLIGEKFVECTPGRASTQPLAEIEDGEEGEGDYLLPLETPEGGGTSSPVDLDLINNTLRRPFRERLALLLAEFGTGVAGRGEDLNEVIHRANPALRETDRVLKILADQNRVLADLARDSDQALAPLAREKERVTDFIEQANATGQATAARRADIERGIQRLPAFLRELRPLMADLEGFSGQATPVMRDLNAAGPALSRVFQELGPFSEGARDSLVSLGEATETGRPALLRTRPLIRDLGRFGRQGRPLSTNLDRLTASLDQTGALERLMDFIYYSTLATNGFDNFGHYLRAALIVNLCTTYAADELSAGCSANFTATRPVSAGAGSRLEPRLAAEPTDDAPQADALDLRGMLDTFLGRGAGTSEEGRSNTREIRERVKQPSPALRDVGDPMLDYLLGSGE